MPPMNRNAVLPLVLMAVAAEREQKKRKITATAIKTAVTDSYGRLIFFLFIAAQSCSHLRLNKQFKCA